MPFIIIGIIIVIIGLYLINIYNTFQVSQIRIQASVQEIGNQLKRQANLIPNLVEAAKGYLKHEKSIFDDLTNARQAILAAVKDQSKVGQATAAIEKMMPQIVALVESNPQLKADGVVTKLMDELRDTSDKLMYSRRSVIDLTADFNSKLVAFPTNIVANVFGFKKQPGLEMPEKGDHLTVSAAETTDVKVSL